MIVAGSMAALAAGCGGELQQEAAAPPALDPIEHGQYLVSISGCHDCHTPGYFFGMPDMSMPLAGSDAGFMIPGMGYFYGPNLTADAGTGLGNWSEEEIVTAIRTGMRPDGRILAPIMPWMNLATLTDEDAYAIAAYLKSLPPISRQAPPPTGIDQPPPAPYFAMTFPPGMEPPAPPPPAP